MTEDPGAYEDALAGDRSSVHDDPSPFEVVLLDRLERLERMLENVASLCCPYCRDGVLERLHPDEVQPKTNGKVRR